jgi:transcription termination factor NusB
MRVGETARQEAVARAWEILHRSEPLSEALRFLSTQLLAKRQLNRREKENLLKYEATLVRQIDDEQLTVSAAIKRHVKHLDRLAASTVKPR